MSDDDRLKGWKAIAAYLQASTRTVQRWEATLGLPVHRVGGANSAIVFASRLELDRWSGSTEGLAATSGKPAGESVPSTVVASVTTGQNILASSEPSAGEFGGGHNPALASSSSSVGGSRWMGRPAVFAGGLGVVVASLVYVVGPVTSAGALPQSPRADAGAAAPQNRRAPKPSALASIRLTPQDGPGAVILLLEGASVLFSPSGGGDYLLSAEALDGGARISVARTGDAVAEADGAGGRTSYSMRFGESTPVTGFPGLVKIELLPPDAMRVAERAYLAGSRGHSLAPRDGGEGRGAGR